MSLEPKFIFDQLRRRIDAVDLVFGGSDTRAPARKDLAIGVAGAVANVSLALENLVDPSLTRGAQRYSSKGRTAAITRLAFVRRALIREFQRAISLEPDPGPDERLTSSYDLTKRLTGGTSDAG